MAVAKTTKMEALSEGLEASLGILFSELRKPKKTAKIKTQKGKTHEKS